MAVSQVFIFHFKWYSLLQFAVCQLLCWAFLCTLQDLVAVDHAKIYYRPFRKDFYVEVPEIANMSPEGECRRIVLKRHNSMAPSVLKLSVLVRLVLAPLP